MRWTKCLAAAAAAITVEASTLTPPVIPLIVRNPYLSTWLGNARDVPWNRWPIFWTGQEVRPHQLNRVQLKLIAPSRLDYLYSLQYPNLILCSLYLADRTTLFRILARGKQCLPDLTHND